MTGHHTAQHSIQTARWCVFFASLSVLNADRAATKVSKTSIRTSLALEAVLMSDRRVSNELGGLCGEGSNRSASAMIPLVGIPGLGLARDAAKIMAACAICAVLYYCISKIDCNSKRFDCRRCRCCARNLLLFGYDEFEGFGVNIKIHSIADIKTEGFLGSKEFKVKVAFGWSKWETAATTDLRWEQTKLMEVPQGACECVIQLWSINKAGIKSKEADFELETKKDMLDREEDFWGKKQKLKLEKKGKHIGTLSVTFRRKGDDAGGESGNVSLPIKGVDEDSGLAVELQTAWEELQKRPGFVPRMQDGKLEGDSKVLLLSEVLEGNLRQVSKKGKEKGKVFIKVLRAHKSELAGDDCKEEMKKAIEKARQKGQSDLERKWYWVVYEDKKAYEKKKTHPEEFIAMISILKVNRSPDRNDQFIITYGDDGDKEMLIYRRDSGKGLDVWMDGLELCFTTCRDMVKENQKKTQMKEDAEARMWAMHKSWLAQKGPPMSHDDWARWRQWFVDSNFDTEMINALQRKLAEQHAQAQKNQPKAAQPKAPQAKQGQPKAGTKSAQPKAKQQGGRR